MSNCRQEELSLESSELHPDDAEAVEQGAIAVELVVGPEPRRNRIRGKTVSTKRLSKQKLFEGKIEADALLEGVEYTRPRTRGDCLQGENAQRPCPFLSCRFHLYLDVNPKSCGIKFNFDHLEAYEIPESCALDVADKGGDTLENIGLMMNLTRERVRQLEASGLAKLRQLSSLAAHADHLFGDVSRPDLNEPEHKYSGIGRIEVSKALHRVVPNSAPTERAIRAGKRGGGTSRMRSEAMAAALSELRAELGTERLALELDLSAYTVAALCRGDNVSFVTLRKAAEYLAGREQVA